MLVELTFCSQLSCQLSVLAGMDFIFTLNCVKYSNICTYMRVLAGKNDYTFLAPSLNLRSHWAELSPGGSESIFSDINGVMPVLRTPHHVS